VTLATIVLLGVVCAAAAFDLRTRRIPNALTGAAALAALAFHLPAGLLAVTIALAAMLCAFVAGSLAFSAGWFGGGDVKLLTACCGFASFPGSVSLVLYVLAAGALLALVTAAARGRLVALVRSTATVAAHGAPGESEMLLPYGVAIAAGSCAYAASTVVPALRLSL
jgi:Flp pilus assembly protein protease CpaA